MAEKTKAEKKAETVKSFTVEDPYKVPQDLLDLATHYRGVRQGAVLKSIATARDVKMGRDPRTGIASLYPDYGPKGRVPAAEKARLGTELAKASANLARLAKSGTATKAEIDGALDSWDQQYTDLYEKVIAGKAAVEGRKVGAYSDEAKALRERTKELEKRIPGSPTSATPLVKETRVAMAELAGKWPAVEGDASGTMLFAEKMAAALETIDPSFRMAALNFMATRMGFQHFGEFVQMVDATGESFPGGGSTDAWSNIRTNTPGLDDLFAESETALGPLQAEIDDNWDEWAKAQKKISRAGVYMPKEYKEKKERIDKLRKEQAEYIRKHGAPNPTIYMLIANEVGASTTAVLEAGGFGPPKGKMTPTEKAARGDIEKGWDLLEEGSDQPALQRLTAKIMADKRFTDYMRLRGYTDKNYAFKKLIQESRQAARTNTKRHRAIDRVSAMTGAIPKADLTPAKALAAEVRKGLAVKKGETASLEAAKGETETRLAEGKEPEVAADPSLKEFFAGDEAAEAEVTEEVEEVDDALKPEEEPTTSLFPETGETSPWGEESWRAKKNEALRTVTV
jgi:hypothetical protein